MSDSAVAPTLDDSLALSPDAVFRELDGELVILDLATSTYFGLNEVGARIWTLIQHDGSLRRALAALAREYEAPAADLERDLLRLAGDLCARGLARVGTAREP